MSTENVHIAQCTMGLNFSSIRPKVSAILTCFSGHELDTLITKWFVDLTVCAAKAFYSCPAIISQRLESQKIPKEPQEYTEEESKII